MTSFCLLAEGSDSMVSVRKRGKVYEYRFSVASIDGVRKWIQKSGFKTRQEALQQGAIAYNKYYRVGRVQKQKNMSYSDFLDYWIDTYCNFNKIFTFEFNVIVTFFISFMMLLAYEKINNKILKWLCVILIITLSLPCDWAIIGPLFVLTFYLNKKSKKEMTIWYSILVSIMIILNSFFILNNGYHWYGELWQLGLFMFIPVLYMYDGKKIKLNIFNKWIFYVFYPLHFIIIGIIKLLIN